METCDDEFVAAAKDFIKRQHKAGTPFFVWLNTTHMHLRTHTKPSSLGQAGRWQSPYHDTMIDHDKNVGEVPSISKISATDAVERDQKPIVPEDIPTFKIAVRAHQILTIRMILQST